MPIEIINGNCNSFFDMQFKDYSSLWLPPIIYSVLCILTVLYLCNKELKTKKNKTHTFLPRVTNSPVCLGPFWFSTESFASWEPPGSGKTGVVGYSIARFKYEFWLGSVEALIGNWVKWETRQGMGHPFAGLVLWPGYGSLLTVTEA